MVLGSVYLSPDLNSKVVVEDVVITFVGPSITAEPVRCIGCVFDLPKTLRTSSFSIEDSEAYENALNGAINAKTTSTTDFDMQKRLNIMRCIYSIQ